MQAESEQLRCVNEVSQQHTAAPVQPGKFLTHSAQQNISSPFLFRNNSANESNAAVPNMRTTRRSSATAITNNQGASRPKVHKAKRHANAPIARMKLGTTIGTVRIPADQTKSTYRRGVVARSGISELVAVAKEIHMRIVQWRKEDATQRKLDSAILQQILDQTIANAHATREVPKSVATIEKSMDIVAAVNIAQVLTFINKSLPKARRSNGGGYFLSVIGRGKSRAHECVQSDIFAIFTVLSKRVPSPHEKYCNCGRKILISKGDC
eukprot:IDg2729t1